MKKYLITKLCGAKMALIGLGGRGINEISGLISGEAYTTYQLNKLPNGYIQKGLGHVLGNRRMINKGRIKINESRISSKNLTQVMKWGAVNYAKTKSL